MPPSSHATASDVERELCEELARQGLGHEHRSLHFRVRDATGAPARYDPEIVVRRGTIIFLLESVPRDAEASGKVALMTRFLEQHSPELVLVAVAAEGGRSRLPPDAYDEVYDAAELPRIVRRIREQDPEGIVEPFEKDRGR